MQHHEHSTTNSVVLSFPTVGMSCVMASQSRLELAKLVLNFGACNSPEWLQHNPSRVAALRMHMSRQSMFIQAQSNT